MTRPLRLALPLPLLLLIGGCAEFTAPERLPEETRREVYQQVREQVAELLFQAELAEQRGELGPAAELYQKAFFFDPAQGAARAKGERLAKQAPVQAAQHYQRGLKLEKRDRRGALKAFNRARRIDPTHPEAAQEAMALLAEPALAGERDRLAQKLAEGFARFGRHAEELPALDRQVEAVLALDAAHPATLEIRRELDRERRRLAPPVARRPGPEGKGAEPSPEAAAAPPPPAVARPAVEPGERQRQAAEARRLLEAGHYAAALPLLRSQLEPPAADPAMAAALRAELAPQLPRLLAEGRRLFEAKQLEESLPLFQCAQLIDPENESARVYARKASDRLRTLRQLER